MSDYRNRPPVDAEREILVNWWAVLGLIVAAGCLGVALIGIALAVGFVKP